MCVSVCLRAMYREAVDFCAWLYPFSCHAFFHFTFIFMSVCIVCGFLLFSQVCVCMGVCLQGLSECEH